MFKTKFTIVVFIIATMPFIGKAQPANTGNWFIYFGNQAINKKWNWWNEVQYRNYNLLGDLQQLLLRTGISYNLTENNNNVLIGYAYIKNARYAVNNIDKLESEEHRLYQQFIFRQNFGRVFLQHRYRVEERFLPNDFKIRLRYFLAVNIPINKKAMSSKAIYLSAYNEIFVNTEQPTFDRNRLYAALGYVLDKNVRIEIGGMAQTLDNEHRNQLQIVVFNNLSLHSK
jgi:hypothetical protein